MDASLDGVHLLLLVPNRCWILNLRVAHDRLDPVNHRQRAAVGQMDPATPDAQSALTPQRVQPLQDNTNPCQLSIMITTCYCECVLQCMFSKVAYLPGMAAPRNPQSTPIASACTWRCNSKKPQILKPVTKQYQQIKRQALHCCGTCGYCAGRSARNA